MKQSRNNGYALVEITATLFVLMTGLFGVLQMYNFGLDRIRTVNESAIAMQTLQNELDSLRSARFDALQSATRDLSADPYLAETLIRGVLTTEVQPVEQLAVKQVSVSITWSTENGRHATRTLTTLIAEKAP